MRKYLVVAAILSLASMAGAVPTYTSTVADLGGGLYGHTFTASDPAMPLPGSAWFVEMQWWGASAAEAVALPGVINQQLAFGSIPVHEEVMADTYDPLDPNYSKILDTWIKNEFGNAIMLTVDTANYYERQSGTAAGLQYVTVDHAYIVATGDVVFNGRLGVDVGGGAVVWTNVSGISVPEPATMLLLGLGGLGVIIRRRR